MSRVALVHNVNRGRSERETEFDSPATIDMLHGIIAEQHDCQPIEATQDMAWIPQLTSYRPDVVFNVAEGFHGPAREAVYPAIFEQLGMPYCGPDPTNLAVTLNKHLTKQLLVGIPYLHIPESQVWDDTLDPQALHRGRYILKLMHEGSSIGMQLAPNAEAVPALTQTMQAQHNDAVMIEQFVEGDDVSMAYVEGLGVLGPAAVSLPEAGFYDYSLKSHRDSEVQIGIPALPAERTERLHSVATALVDRLDLKGYAKIDLRLKNDDINLIEVNGQVSFHPDGEFAHCCQADGHSLSSVVHTILNTGLHTQRRSSIGVCI